MAAALCVSFPPPVSLPFWSFLRHETVFISLGSFCLLAFYSSASFFSKLQSGSLSHTEWERCTHVSVRANISSFCWFFSQRKWQVLQLCAPYHFVESFPTSQPVAHSLFESLSNTHVVQWPHTGNTLYLSFTFNLWFRLFYLPSPAHSFPIAPLYGTPAGFISL